MTRKKLVQCCQITRSWCPIDSTFSEYYLFKKSTVFMKFRIERIEWSNDFSFCVYWTSHVFKCESLCKISNFPIPTHSKQLVSNIFTNHPVLSHGWLCKRLNSRDFLKILFKEGWFSSNNSTICWRSHCYGFCTSRSLNIKIPKRIMALP